ncbi:MAG: hypothetical protein ACE37D_01105 [Pseudomonadales bacterium]
MSYAEEINWPPLPTNAFTSGKLATQQDVEAGRAVFSMQSGEELVGEYLDILIPQYAFHIDEESGTKTPVIIIQAETNGVFDLVGYTSIADDSVGMGLVSEFELLGTNLSAGGK